MAKKIICPTCKQDMAEPPHEGMKKKDCPQCGQGLSWRKAKKKNKKAPDAVKSEERKTEGG